MQLPFSSLADASGTLRIFWTLMTPLLIQLAWTSTQSLAIAPVQYQQTIQPQNHKVLIESCKR